ncbi:hypothetical protein [Kitasatospora sp. NPDC051914]|uniref:hypothetical protein n=1 Tax=Kitasatospora sp. NPDC051914 TaxID=3154945 RepID=UPI0034186221
MPDIRRTALLAASAAAVIALVTACESDGYGSNNAGGTTAPAASSPAAPNSPSEQSPTSPAPAGGGTGLQTATSSTLGTIVTDGSGYTLYRFDKDTAKPPVSNCNGECAKLWPPVMASDNPQLKGIDAKLVSTVTRADGSKQVTLNGWPLYRYTPDTKPGDTKGQGVGGIWWAVTPTGAKAAAAASPATGGYGY